MRRNFPDVCDLFACFELKQIELLCIVELIHPIAVWFGVYA